MARARIAIGIDTMRLIHQRAFVGICLSVSAIAFNSCKSVETNTKINEGSVQISEVKGVIDFANCSS